MKTQLSKRARSKARYTEEYKKEALELWRASGRSAAKVAAELGIRAPLLYRWASSPKRRREVCPNRTNERPIQDSLVVRSAPGLAQWLLRLDQTPSIPKSAPTGEHALT